MELNQFLDGVAESDPTWARALRIVKGRLRPNSNLWRLLRGGWAGQLDLKGFIRLTGFSRLRLTALIRAAQPGILGGEQPASNLEEAVKVLGLRVSAAVLAVNYTFSAVLKTHPPPLWKALLQETMSNIEIGTKVGARVGAIGMHGGIVVGFARGAGLGMLLAQDPNVYKRWRFEKDAYTSAKSQIDAFGCEIYQVSALILQQLGFGPEMGVGAALGAGRLANAAIHRTEEVELWRAAFQWIDALRDGRGYPPLEEDRTFFQELDPRVGSQTKNPILSVLYTEVSKVKNEGSSWTWHLPRDTYEATADLLEMSATPPANE